MVIFFGRGECTYPPLVEIRENPEFHDLMRMDKGHWPRSLLWYGWLLLFFGTYGDSPWAETAVQGAGNLLEQALGSYSSRLIFDCGLPRGFDDAALQVSEQPDVWTDGSLVLDEVSGASSSGSRKWGHFDELGPVGGVGGS